MDNLTERISWALNILKDDKSVGMGVTDKELSKLFGTNEKTLAEYRNGRGLIKGSVIEGLVSQYQFNPEWLLRGAGEPFPGARQRYKSVCGPMISLSVNEPCGEYGDYVYVPQMTGRISAGGGLVPDDRVNVRIAFRKAWIQRKGDPTRMSLVKVSGDSMEPTLLPGDLVLINHDRDCVDPQGGIYAIAVNSEIMIKRIHIVYPDGKVRIISDNRKYAPMEVETEKVHINGKVIWYGRELDR